MPFTICFGLLRLTDHCLLSLSSLLLLKDINETSIRWLFVIVKLWSPFPLGLLPFFHSLSLCSLFSPIFSSRQRDSSEVWHPGGWRRPIQHLQLPALWWSLWLRASRWMGREFKSEQWFNSLAQRSSAHVAVQRPLWAQWDEENAGR